MMKSIRQKLFLTRNTKGDTIVEVLIAIAVAAFAISASYAIANQSLQQAITAHERNEALNIIENQIADLKARYKYTFFSDPTAFKNNFAAAPSVGGSGPYPASNHHYCLLDSATVPTAANPLPANWLPLDNNITSSAQADNLSPRPSGPYNDTGGNACIRHLTTTDYYVDVVPQVTASSANALNRTVYEVNVRWSPVGGGANQHAVIYYRLPGDAVATTPSGSVSGGGVGGLACGLNHSDVVLALDASNSMSHPFTPDINGDIKLAVEKQSAVNLINGLQLSPAGNHAGVIEFHDFSYVLSPLTSDTAALINDIRAIQQTSNNTNYGATLTASRQMLNGSVPPRNKILVFMSDGVPNGGISTPAVIDLATAMKNSGIVIYTIGIDVSAGGPAQLLMQQIAGGTDSSNDNGRYVSVNNTAQFNSVVQDLAGQILC